MHPAFVKMDPLVQFFKKRIKQDKVFVVLDETEKLAYMVAIILFNWDSLLAT